MTQIEMQAMEAVKGIYREMKAANEVNWEQRRYEIAKDVLVGMLSNPNIVEGDVSTPIVGVSVQIADLLIAELKKEK